MASPERSTTSTRTASIVAFTPKVFENSISDKLDDESFLPQQQLALASTSAHNLEDYLGKDKVPTHFALKEDEFVGTESQTYRDWS